MMTINKNSWHYRLASVYRTDKGQYRLKYNTHDLCVYIQQVLWGVFNTSFITLFISVLLIAPTLSALSLFTGLNQDHNYIINHAFEQSFINGIITIASFLMWTMVAVFCFCVISIGIVGGLCFTGYEITKTLLSKYNLKHREPSIVTRAIKDRLDKICTLVKFE